MAPLLLDTVYCGEGVGVGMEGGRFMGIQEDTRPKLIVSHVTYTSCSQHYRKIIQGVHAF